MLLVIMLDSFAPFILDKKVMPFLWDKANANSNRIELVPPFAYYSEYSWFLGQEYWEFPGGFRFQIKANPFDTVNIERNSRIKEIIMPDSRLALSRLKEESLRANHPMYEMFELSCKYSFPDIKNDGTFMNPGSIYKKVSPKYLSINWPNLLSCKSVLPFLEEKLNSPDLKFIYLQLSEIDPVAHRYGPNAPETAEIASQLDCEIKNIIMHLEGGFNKTRVVVFGDHGFTEVYGIYDPDEILKNIPIRWGEEAAYFIDSTVIRLWGEDRILLSLVLPVIKKSMPTVRVLSRKDLQYPDNRFGDFFILCPLGSIFYPDFLSGTSNPPPCGMHGYYSESYAMRSSLVAWGDGIVPPTTNLKLQMKSVYHLMNCLMLEDVPAGLWEDLEKGFSINDAPR